MVEEEKIGLELFLAGLSDFLGGMSKANKSAEELGWTFDETANRWRDASGRFVSDSKLAAEGFKTLEKEGGGALSGLREIAVGALREIGAAAINMAADGARAVGAFVGDSIGAATEFERGQSVLQAASGATSEQMKELRDTAIALGNDITLPATSAQSASAAMTELVKAGLSVADSQNAARGALQLATAAQIDEATAASIVAGALNTFHLEGTEATKIADMLSAGANASAASATDLADGFKQAGFAFEANNQDADDLITSLSMLTNVGLTGSDAGTALKNAMMKLAAPTEQGAKLMEGLGLNVFDANGQMLPMKDIIGLTNKALAGMTDEQRNAALMTIFQSDGMKAMIPLLDAGVSGYDAMNAKVNESGAAAKMAGAQTQGFAGAQAALANSLDTLQLIIGTTLLPILTELFNKYLIPGIQWVMGLVQSFIDAGAAGGSFGDAIAGMIPGFDSVIAAVNNVIPLIETLLTAFSTVFEGIRAIVEAVLGQVALFIDAHGDEISALFADAWALIQDVIKTAAAFYEKVIAPALQQIAKWISDHSAEIQSVFSTAWGLISGAIKLAINTIRTILQIVMKLISGDTSGALEQIKGVFIDIWNAISTTVQGIVDGMKNAISSKLTEIRNGISGAFTGALDAVRATLTQWVELGKGIITSIVDGIGATVNQLVSTLRAAVLSAFNSALSIFPAPIAAAIRQFLGIGGANANSVMMNSTAANFGSAGGGDKVYSPAYYLNVNSGQSTGSIRMDFAIMKALA